jgi:hypothetical protein
MVARHARSGNPDHLTLGGDTYTSETPKTRRNCFKDCLSRSRADKFGNVGLQEPIPYLFQIKNE